MTFEQSISESTECHPGIEVLVSAYFPVAMYLTGSRDYYYINAVEGEAGAPYRIYHDSASGRALAKDGIKKVYTAMSLYSCKRPINKYHQYTPSGLNVKCAPCLGRYIPILVGRSHQLMSFIRKRAIRINVFCRCNLDLILT